MTKNTIIAPTKPKLAFELVRPQIRKVEAQIREQVEAFDPEVAPYIDYICKTSGKRIRPALAILTGGALTGQPNSEHIKVGVILELIHMASLVHDDIIDGADTRRDEVTPNARWGNGLAVLLGDALFAHAMTMATDFNSIEICKEVGNASRAVCQGEIRQTQARFDLKLTKDSYFEIIGMKTGALFATATKLAAKVSGADEATQKSLYDAGMTLGTAYQIYDDCLDLVGDENDAGKTLRTDLERGKLTLPLLHILEQADRKQVKVLQSRINEDQFLDLDFMESISPFPPAIHYSVEHGLKLIAEVRQSLDVLPTSKFKDALLSIPDSLEEMLRRCLI